MRIPPLPGRQNTLLLPLGIAHQTPRLALHQCLGYTVNGDCNIVVQGPHDKTRKLLECSCVILAIRYSTGAMSCSPPCGLSSLYFFIQMLLISCTSLRLRKSYRSSTSSRYIRLNSSTHEFCISRPRWINSSWALWSSAHPARATETNSGLLSMRSRSE